MNKFILIFITLAFISCDSELDTIIFKHFQKFITKYNKKYSSINEFIARYQVFRSNLMELFNSPNTSFKTGITQFSDLTKQEFSKNYLNLNYDAIAVSNFSPYTVKNIKGAPDEFDWRDYGVVERCRDQGACGANWALATMGNLEALYAAHYGIHKTFSTQMLIDCDTNDSGCNGGLMEYAYTYLKKLGGIMYDADYPYKGTKQTCKYDSSKRSNMIVTGYKKLGSSWSTWSPVDEDEIKEFLYETGPLGIALNGNCLQTYTSGIIDLSESQCPPSGINVAALLVGYGVSNGIPYWLVQNFWGCSWGEKGYFRIRRGNGTCGINCYIITGLVAFDD